MLLFYVLVLKIVNIEGTGVMNFSFQVNVFLKQGMRKDSQKQYSETILQKMVL